MIVQNQRIQKPDSLFLFVQVRVVVRSASVILQILDKRAEIMSIKFGKLAGRKFRGKLWSGGFFRGTFRVWQISAMFEESAVGIGGGSYGPRASLREMTED